MRRVLLLGAALLVAAGAFPAPAGAQSDEGELKKKYEKKLAKEFVNKIPWKMTLDEAMAEAKAKRQLILGYFTRSYTP